MTTACSMQRLPVWRLWYPSWYTPRIFTSAEGTCWNTAFAMYSKYAGATSLNIWSSVRLTNLTTKRPQRVRKKRAPDLPPRASHAALDARL